MRKLISGLLLIALAVAGSGTALADTFSVSADVPVVYTFSESAFHDTSANGAIVGVSLPFLLGFGAESYKAKGKIGTTTLYDFEYKVTMGDIFFDIPFPVANLRVGAGVGNGDLTAPTSPFVFEKARLVQGFFNVGIPFGGVFDAHVGYHVISGETKDSTQPTNPSLNISSRMATVGIKVGF